MVAKMKRDLNLESWKVFAAVAEAGSISAAAPKLGIDPPSASRVISALEKSLGGVPLFDRSSHRMALTENGRMALEAAKGMLSIHDMLLRNLEAKTSSMVGPIRVGVPPALLQSFLMPFLVGFAKKYPEVQLDLAEYTAGLPVSFDSKQGKLDLVIAYGPDPVHENYVQIHYGTGHFLNCASPVYLARHGVPRSIEELSRHTGVVFNSPLRGVSTRLKRGTEEKEVRFQREFDFSSALSAKSAAVIGAGIALGMADLHCYRELQKGELVPVLPDWLFPDEELYMYTTPEALRLARVKTFIRAYRETIEPILEESRRTTLSLLG